MSRRILVPVDRTTGMERVLTIVRGIARTNGAIVRLAAVLPIPGPLRDRFGQVRVSVDTQMERLLERATAELRMMAAIYLDGIQVQTSVVFGDRAAEIGIEAECLAADLVVVTDERRWSVRALLAGLAGRRTSGTPSHARILHMPA